MMPPSYQFAGLDAEMMELTQELEALGGGDAKSVAVDLHYVVHRDAGMDSSKQTVWAHDNSIGIRDIRNTQDLATTASMKYYAATSTTIIETNENPVVTEALNHLVDSSTRWLTSGFNGCLLSIGPTMLRKTDTLFSNMGHNSADIEINLTSQILRSLFHLKAQTAQDVEMRIGLSAWIFDGARNVDLMVRVAETSLPLEFTIVECPTVDTAVQVLSEVRSRASGCLSSNPNFSRTRRLEEDKSSFFLRIVLYQRDLRDVDRGTSRFDAGNTSSLYIVDLLGFVDVESGAYYKTLPNQEKIVVRNRNLQLQSLIQLLQEMASISRNALQYASQYGARDHFLSRYAKLQDSKALTSARSAKLSKILAPILQGNTKTSILVHVRDSADIHHWEQTRDIVGQLQYVPEIKTAVYKVEDVPFYDLNFKSHLTVLGPSPDHRNSRRKASPSKNFDSKSPIIKTSSTTKVYQPSEEEAKRYIYDRQIREVQHEINEQPGYERTRKSLEAIRLDHILTDNFDPANFDKSSPMPHIRYGDPQDLTDQLSRPKATVSPERSRQGQETPRLKHRQTSSLHRDVQQPLELQNGRERSPTPQSHQQKPPADSRLASSASDSIKQLMNEFHTLMHMVEQPASSRPTTPHSRPLSTPSAPSASASASYIRSHRGEDERKQLYSFASAEEYAAVSQLMTREPPSQLVEQSSEPIRRDPKSNKYLDLILESRDILHRHRNDHSRSRSNSASRSPDRRTNEYNTHRLPPRSLPESFSYPNRDKSPTSSSQKHLSKATPRTNSYYYGGTDAYRFDDDDAFADDVVVAGIGGTSAETELYHVHSDASDLVSSRYERRSSRSQRAQQASGSSRNVFPPSADDVQNPFTDNKDGESYRGRDRVHILGKDSEYSDVDHQNYDDEAESFEDDGGRDHRRDQPYRLSSPGDEDSLDDERNSSRPLQPRSSQLPPEPIDRASKGDRWPSASENRYVRTLHAAGAMLSYDTHDRRSRSRSNSPGSAASSQLREKKPQTKMPSVSSSSSQKIASAFTQTEEHNKDGELRYNRLYVDSSIPSPTLLVESRPLPRLEEHLHVLDSDDNANNDDFDKIDQKKRSSNSDPKGSAVVNTDVLHLDPKAEIHKQLAASSEVNAVAASTSSSATAQIMAASSAEMEKLNRVKESLILALQNEKAHRLRLEQENQQLRDGYVEVSAQHEVEVDSLRYQVRSLQQQVKSLCAQGACLDVFEHFERDVARLVRENQMLREVNLQLEHKHLQDELAMNADDVSSKDLEAVSASMVSHGGDVTKKDQHQDEIAARKRKLQQQWERNSAKQKMLVEKLRVSGKERENWKQEYERLKAKERQFVVTERMHEDTSRRLKKAFSDLQRIKKEHEQQSLRLLECERENGILKHDVVGFQKQEELLRAERDRLLSEVAECRTRIKYFEQEDARVAKLNRFVHKHSGPSTTSNVGSLATAYTASAGRVNSAENKQRADLGSGAKSSTAQPASRGRTVDPHVAERLYSSSSVGTHQKPSSSLIKSAIASNYSSQRPRHQMAQRLQEQELSEVMHDSITQHAPSLLPLFQKLADETRF